MKNMNMNVYMPTKLITGKDCIKKNSHLLKTLGKRCLIVTGKNSAKLCGALNDVTVALETENISYVIYDCISQNPHLVDCEEAGILASKEKVDFIIGIGGGSPLDSAKCIAVVASNPTYKEKEIYSLQWENNPLPIVCVGTTSGTGSEVTKVAVITNYQGSKKSFKDDRLYPVISFGDERYTAFMSDYFTRSTALDALAHCMESYFNTTANEISQAYALRGIELLLPKLAQMIEKGTDSLTEEDRATLYNASIYGGLAINLTGTAVPHTVGYLLTEEHQIPHGLACAVFLPTFLELTIQAKPELVLNFFTKLQISKEDYVNLILKAMPSYEVVMDEDEIQTSHKRWINNASIAKTWGNVQPEVIDDMLRDLFVR